MGRAVSRWSLAAGEPIRVRGDDTGTSLIGELRVHLSEILPRFSTIIIIYMLFVPGGRVGEDWETPIKTVFYQKSGNRLDRKVLIHFLVLEGFKGTERYIVIKAEGM